MQALSGARRDKYLLGHLRPTDYDRRKSAARAEAEGTNQTADIQALTSDIAGTATRSGPCTGGQGVASSGISTYLDAWAREENQCRLHALCFSSISKVAARSCWPWPSAMARLK
jgi:hypothetical protein